MLAHTHVKRLIDDIDRAGHSYVETRGRAALFLRLAPDANIGRGHSCDSGPIGVSRMTAGRAYRSYVADNAHTRGTSVHRTVSNFDSSCSLNLCRSITIFDGDAPTRERIDEKYPNI